MKSLKCPYCGDTINVVRGKSVQKCSSCGNEFVLDKEEVSEYDVLIENANEFLKLEEYKKACGCFETANKLNPKGYEAWIGLAKSETENFKKLSNGSIKKIENYIESAKNLATRDELKLFDEDLENFNELKKSYEKNKKENRNYVNYNITVMLLSLFLIVICLIINIVYTMKSTASSVSKIGDCLILSAIVFVISNLMYHLFKFIKPKSKTSMAILIIVNVLICAIIIFADVSFAMKI